MRFSCQLLPEQPLDELLDLIALADELGFDACYSADETYHKDMWTLFAAAAGRTRRIRLGPEVTHVILRDPTMIAQQAATLDELTRGAPRSSSRSGTSRCSTSTTSSGEGPVHCGG
jgi:5,10-methylenetetrahydromethanopterin reductase